MSIPEAGCPHMAVCLEDRRHAGRTVVYCMIGKIMKLNEQWKITLELLCTLLYVFVFHEEYLNLHKLL